MLAVEEIRCERCHRLLRAHGADHKCRTLEEQLAALRALAGVHQPTAEESLAMDRRRRREFHDRQRRDLD